MWSKYFKENRQSNITTYTLCAERKSAEICLDVRPAEHLYEELRSCTYRAQDRHSLVKVKLSSKIKLDEVTPDAANRD